jgi:hypothetical protein
MAPVKLIQLKKMTPKRKPTLASPERETKRCGRED